MKFLVLAIMLSVSTFAMEAKSNTFGNYIVKSCTVVDGLVGASRSVDIGESNGVWFYKYANFYSKVVVPGAKKELVDKVTILKTDKETKTREVLSGTAQSGKKVTITIKLNKKDQFGGKPGVLEIGTDKLPLSCRSLAKPM